MPDQILIVEDEPELLRALSIRLSAAGFTTHEAKDGIEGLDRAREERPDLIIIDLLMPEADGYNLCRQLRTDARTSSIPVLVLTVVSRHLLGRRSKDQDQRKRLVGTPTVLQKPFETEELLSTIQGLLAKQ